MRFLAAIATMMALYLGPTADAGCGPPECCLPEDPTPCDLRQPPPPPPPSWPYCQSPDYCD